jgi:molybdenum cofactor synthesis domain-containing protein
VTAGDIALMTACGINEIECYTPLRIGVVSTGEEIRTGQVGDTNRAYLLNRLGQTDICNIVEVVDLGILADDFEGFKKLVMNNEYDILLTSGSVSKGKTDYFKAALEQSPGVEILFGQVDMKPGKPTTVATVDRGRRFIFCLPGNPASCFVTFNLLVIPSILRMAGSENPGIQISHVHSIEGPSIREIVPDLERPEYLRAIASIDSSMGVLKAKLVDGHHRSSRVASISGSVNCLIIIPPGNKAILTDNGFDIVLLRGSEIGVSESQQTKSMCPRIQDKAMAFDKLVNWLQTRTDVENIQLMDLAGFCRNCLSKWLAGGGSLDDARTYVYGMDYEEWKSKYRKGDKREHGPRLATSQPCASSIAPTTASYPASILTISDRASAGIYTDESGPAISNFLVSKLPGIQVAETAIVPDEPDEIRRHVLAWTQMNSEPRLIITTGGTGHSIRDVTPDTIEPLLTKKSTGLVHLLLSAIIQTNPMHALTRPVIGMIGQSLVICLPGHPTAVVDGLSILRDHIIKILNQLSAVERSA